MKKLISLLLATVLVLSLCASGAAEATSEKLVEMLNGLEG